MIKEVIGKARSSKNDMIAENSSIIVLSQDGGATECPNCIVKNGVSTGYYKDGGSVPFTGGVCPVCGGSGKIISQNKKEVNCTYRYVSNNMIFNNRIGVSTDTQYLIFIKKENILEFELDKRIQFEFNGNNFEISENGIKNDPFRDYIRFAIRG